MEHYLILFKTCFYVTAAASSNWTFSKILLLVSFFLSFSIVVLQTEQPDHLKSNHLVNLVNIW